MPPPCILFLDFDGVLHPAGSRRNVGDLAQLPLLENLLREPAYAAVRIVISSTWREAYPLDRLRALFSADIRTRVVGATPVLDEYDSDYNRYEEIKAWLEAHPQIERWVALDDDVEGFPSHRRSKVVFTQSSVGLTEESVVLLRQALG